MWQTEGFTHSSPHNAHRSGELRVFYYEGLYYLKSPYGHPLAYAETLDELLPIIHAEAEKPMGAFELVRNESYEDYLTRIRAEGHTLRIRRAKLTTEQPRAKARKSAKADELLKELGLE